MAEQAWTPGILYGGGRRGYPMLAPSAGGSPGDTEPQLEHRVYGEVYGVSKAQLARLDELEDYREGRKRNLFNRIQQVVRTDRGTLEAWVYVQPDGHRAPGAPIPSGDWKFHQVRGKTDLLYLAYGSVMDDARLRADGVLPATHCSRTCSPSWCWASSRRRHRRWITPGRSFGAGLGC